MTGLIGRSTGPRSDVHLAPLPRASATPRWPGPRELGASHADFRFERVRYQHLGVRDGVLQGASDTEDLGFAVRVIHRGAWGFASGVVLTAEEAVRVAESAVAVAQVAAEMTSSPGRARPRAGVRRRHLGLVVRRQPARGARPPRRPRCSSTGPTGCAPVPPSTTPRRTSSRCRRTSTTPTSPAPAPPSSGSGCSPGSRRWAPAPTRSTRWPASRRRSAAAGSTSPTAQLGLGRRDRPGPRAARREAQGAERRGRHATTW